MEKQELINRRNEIKCCPLCNGNIEDRKVTIYKELIESLYRVYVWCGKQNIHEFEMKDVKHLLGRNEYARFGDLIRFGGLVYRPEMKDSGKTRKALYGINMERARDFYAGITPMPVQLTLNQITG